MATSVDVAVISVAEDTRDARFHRILAALDDADLSTVAVGVGDPGHLPTTSLATIATRPSPIRRIPIAIRLVWAARADTLMALDPATAVAAWPMARLRGLHLVVDVHEDYAAVATDRPWARGGRAGVVRLAAAAANWVARRADLTIVADDHVPPVTARRRVVVRNIPDPATMPDPSPRIGSPRAIYIGALSASRGLDSMLEAVAAAPAWHLDLVGGLGDRDEDELRTQLERLDIVDRVTWHGRMPPQRAWELARGAWVGLALLAPTVAYRAALPTKLYEYAMVGLPVLATDLPRMREFVTSNDLGVIAGDTAEAARLLRGWAGDPSPLDHHVAAAATWQHGTQAESRPFEVLGGEVARLVGRPSPARPGHQSKTRSRAPDT